MLDHFIIIIIIVKGLVSPPSLETWARRPASREGGCCRGQLGDGGESRERETLRGLCRLQTMKQRQQQQRSDLGERSSPSSARERQAGRRAREAPTSLHTRKVEVMYELQVWDWQGPYVERHETEPPRLP